MWRAVHRLTRQHLRTLARKRGQTLSRDDYSNVRPQQWYKEIRYFLESTVLPSLTDAQADALRESIEEVTSYVDREAQTEQKEVESSSEFDDSMAPTEFEHYCAKLLRDAGWTADATKQSGDQGVDVIAEKSGMRVVFQCKLYSQPVGNKAVQEIVAGKLHESADHACVVTNSSYTPQARKLAKTTGVLLLHYSDLQRVDELL